MISKWKKIWVHVRFFIKFVPFQLFAIATSVYGAAILLICHFFLDLSLIYSTISLLLIPLAILEEKTLKTPLFWFLRDETRFKSKLSIDPHFKYADDFLTFLNGKKENFVKLWIWYNRNRCWNLLKLLGGKSGDEYLVEVIKNTLVHRGEPVDLSTANGFMPYENTAGLKWINKNGDEGYQVFSGLFISDLFSIFGEATLYYRIGRKLYFRHSKCVQLQGFWLWFWRFLLLFMLKWTFKRDLWFTFKYESNEDMGTIWFKVQWEKG